MFTIIENYKALMKMCMGAYLASPEGEGAAEAAQKLSAEQLDKNKDDWITAQDFEGLNWEDKEALKRLLDAAGKQLFLMDNFGSRVEAGGYSVEVKRLIENGFLVERHGAMDRSMSERTDLALVAQSETAPARQGVDIGFSAADYVDGSTTVVDGTTYEAKGGQWYAVATQPASAAPATQADSAPAGQGVDIGFSAAGYDNGSTTVVDGTTYEARGGQWYAVATQPASAAPATQADSAPAGQGVDIGFSAAGYDNGSTTVVDGTTYEARGGQWYAVVAPVTQAASTSTGSPVRGKVSHEQAFVSRRATVAEANAVTEQALQSVRDMNDMILATSDVDAMIQKYRSHKNRHFTVEYFLRELAGTNTPKSYISALKHHESQAEAMMNIDTSKYNRAIRHLHSSYTPTLREDYETAQVMSGDFIKQSLPAIMSIATMAMGGGIDAPLFDIPLPWMEQMVPGVSIDKSKAFFDWIKSGAQGEFHDYEETSSTGVDALQNTQALRNVISRLAPGVDVQYVLNGNLGGLNAETRELVLNYYRYRLVPDIKALRRGGFALVERITDHKYRDTKKLVEGIEAGLNTTPPRIDTAAVQSAFQLLGMQVEEGLSVGGTRVDMFSPDEGYARLHNSAAERARYMKELGIHNMTLRSYEQLMINRPELGQLVTPMMRFPTSTDFANAYGVPQVLKERIQWLNLQGDMASQLDTLFSSGSHERDMLTAINQGGPAYGVFKRRFRMSGTHLPAVTQDRTSGVPNHFRSLNAGSVQTPQQRADLVRQMKSVRGVMGNMSSFDSIIDVLNTTNQGLSTFSDADFETAFVNTLKFRQLSSHERGQITTNVGPNPEIGVTQNQTLEQLSRNGEVATITLSKNYNFYDRRGNLVSERVDAEVILRPDCTNPVGVIPRGPAVEKCITNKLVPGPDFPFDIPSLKKRFLPVTISMLRAIKNFIPGNKTRIVDTGTDVTSTTPGGGTEVFPGGGSVTTPGGTILSFQ